jgi:hypothetical protein
LLTSWLTIVPLKAIGRLLSGRIRLRIMKSGLSAFWKVATLPAGRKSNGVSSALELGIQFSTAEGVWTMSVSLPGSVTRTTVPWTVIGVPSKACAEAASGRIRIASPAAPASRRERSGTVI